MTFVTLLYVVLSLVFGLGLLILVHEWGHFMMARRAGVQIDAFAIGFGRALFSWKRGETEYKICIFPLGGYVKMAGEDPDEESSKNNPRAYSSKSVWWRIGIVLAGPFMNVLLCIVVMPLTFMIGRERPAYEVAPPVIENVRTHSSADKVGLKVGDLIVEVDGKPVDAWEDVQEKILLAGKGKFKLVVQHEGVRREVEMEANRWGLGFHPASFLANQPIIDIIQKDSPAANAGLMPRDQIAAVGDFKIHYWDELSTLLSQGRNIWFWIWARQELGGTLASVKNYLHGGALPLTVLRRNESEPLIIELTPKWDADYARYVIGIQHDPQKIYEEMPMFVRRYGVVESFTLGLQESWKLVSVTGQFFSRLVQSPEKHYQSLGGPVRIIGMFAQIAQEGLAPFLYFMAFFSLQLGLLNLLPIPVLDGGHMVFLTIEAIIGRPLSIKAQVIAQQVGVALLGTLFLVVTFNDISQLEWVQKLLNRFGG